MKAQFLKEWFGAYAGRELGNPARFFASNPEEMIDFIIKCKAEKKPCYMSVQPCEAQDQPCMLERLFFDFDCKEDTSKAWAEAVKFAETLIKFYGVLPFLVFSGRKGYHVYVFLREPVAFSADKIEFAKQLYERLQRKLLKGLEFETLDSNVIGDIKRLARIPYSVHEETGRICQPVALNGRSYEPRSLEIFRVYGLDTDMIRQAVRELKVEDMLRHLLAKKKGHHAYKVDGNRPCIRAALEGRFGPLEGENGHLMRLAIARELLHAGHAAEQVVEMFRDRPAIPDFKREKTAYYVKYLEAHPSKPVRCKRIREWGFCLGNSCPLYKRVKEGRLP